MVATNSRVDVVAAAYQTILDAVPLVDRIDTTAALLVAHRRHQAEIVRELADHAAPSRRRGLPSAWSAADVVAGILLFHQLAEPGAERSGPIWPLLARRVVYALRGGLLARGPLLTQRGLSADWLPALTALPREFAADYGARLLDQRGTRGFAYLGLVRSVAWFEDHCRRHLDERAAAIWPMLAPAGVPFGEEPLAHQAAAAAWDRLCGLFGGRRECAIRYWLLLRLRLGHELANGSELSWAEAADAMRQLSQGDGLSALDDEDLPPGVTWAEARAASASASCTMGELAQFWQRAAALVSGEVVA